MQALGKVRIVHFYLTGLYHPTHERVLCQNTELVLFRPVLCLISFSLTLTHGLAGNEVEFQPGEN